MLTYLCRFLDIVKLNGKQSKTVTRLFESGLKGVNFNQLW